MWLRFVRALPLVLLLKAPCLGEEDYAKDTFDQIQQNLTDEKAVLVDVREVDEWRQGHLADAMLVPLTELGKKAKNDDYARDLAKKVPKDKIIYCHCRRGGRALLAAELFREVGYECRPLKAGFKELSENGFPVADESEEKADR